MTTRNAEWQEFLARLVQRRKGLGMSQQHVAERLGSNRANVASWESGHNMPSGGTVLAWVAALDLRVVLVPATVSEYDVSVGASGDTGAVDVHIGGVDFPMNYGSADTLRDMLTDALDHIDECQHARDQESAGQRVPGVTTWDMYLQSAFNRRAE